VRPEPVARRVLVSGRVQGVWFRESCRREAAGEGVVGWARNLGDGRVEVWVEGAPAAVEHLVTWCRSGPPRAFVSGITIEEVTPQGHTQFRVLD
jgi:acylphosphatase